MEAFIGQIVIWPVTFAPVGWNFCDGTLLSIAQYDALFNLLGTTYGGDGQSTFAVPDLRGRVPIHVSNSYSLGQQGGVESVTLTTNQIPGHGHDYSASTNPVNVASPANAVVGATPADGSKGWVLRIGGGSADFAGPAIGVAGGGQPHDNMQPYQCVNYIICLEGIYPSQN